MDDRERQQALLEAIEDLVPDEPAQPVPPASAASPRRQGTALALIVAGWGFIAWLWVSQPAWVFGPRTAPRHDAVSRDAALRLTLWLERGRVDEYQEEHGRLPGTLEDAGPVEEGVTWLRQGDGYVLSATIDGETLSLADRMDADSFLGNSLDVLRR